MSSVALVVTSLKAVNWSLFAFSQASETSWPLILPAEQREATKMRRSGKYIVHDRTDERVVKYYFVMYDMFHMPAE